MEDHSYLDSKYFIDGHIYNCPFCNRRHVKYENRGSLNFDWSNDKNVTFGSSNVRAAESIQHLTFKYLQDSNTANARFKKDIELDEEFFYSVPTSFFVIDRRIPKTIRELITEAEGCSKMNS